MKKYFLSIVLSFFTISLIQSQIKIGNDPQTIDASSILELESDTSVLVITRVSNAQMNTITPLQGGLVYNNDEDCVFFYNGTEWIDLCEELNTFNVNFEVVDGNLVLTDSNEDSVMVPITDLGATTFTSEPIFNVSTDGTPIGGTTIIITEEDDNINL